MSDYSDIQAELDDFKNAVYGEEVRDSMISAIKKIHDLAESAASAPNATTATAGQAPIADGQGGWAWGDVATSGDSVPTEVRQAILALFQNGVYTRDDMSDEVAVIQSWATEITAISVSPTTLSINGMNQQTIVATTQPAGGAVTWSSSDTTICTVSGGVVTPTGVNGSCTITASCGGKSATCTVAVSGFATLTSISAVYNQSEAVYDTDSLDDLKSDLVVTANYDDDRSVPVTGYVLSGTLTEGTSTITVSYGGKTDTFTVIVSSLSTPITITWVDGTTTATSQLLDATSAEVYFTLPYIEGSTEYASDVTSESDFCRVRAILYNDSEGTDLAGYWHIDNQTIESTTRTTLNTPSMPTDVSTKVAPSGYYAKIVLIKRSGFSSNATFQQFVRNNATDAVLVGVRS